MNCFGWNTTKTQTGFVWRVYGYDSAAPRVVTTLHEGVSATRAIAMTNAKKHVIKYRRSVK